MTPSGMIPFNLKLRNLIAQTMFQTDNKVISKTQDISWQSKINNFPLDFHEKMYFQYQPVKGINYLVQCNLDLVTLNLVTTCDLVTVFYKDRFSIYYIKSFNLVTICDLVTVFAETKSVTKSRLHCTLFSKIRSNYCGTIAICQFT